MFLEGNHNIFSVLARMRGFIQDLYPVYKAAVHFQRHYILTVSNKGIP